MNFEKIMQRNEGGQGWMVFYRQEMIDWLDVMNICKEVRINDSDKRVYKGW